MPRNLTAALALLLCASICGCKANSERMNAAAEQPALPSSEAGVPVVETANVPQTDNANQVLQSCGRPSSDQVLPIYNKLNQGPVRRVTYNQHRSVTLEFIPSHPIERSKAKDHLTPVLPAGSVWRFDVARVPKELDSVTAFRLKLFLPCASKALSSEF